VSYLHTLNTKTLVFDLTYFIVCARRDISKTRFELERGKERERTNRTEPNRTEPNRLSIDPYLRSFFRAAFTLTKRFISTSAERENWNKKREDVAKGGKRTRDRKGAFCVLEERFFFKRKRARTHADIKKEERTDHERLLRAREHVFRRRCVAFLFVVKKRVSKEKDTGRTKIGIFFGSTQSDPTVAFFLSC
jgi:hypothetical protein